MQLREVFSEMPYGAALSEEALDNRCSTCFATDSKTPCSGECKVVVYCSEKCRDTDQKIHEFECVGLRKNAKLDSFARLLVRIATRRRIDRGVADLAENFPKHIPDRHLSDLISHERDIEGNSYRRENMLKIWKQYSQTFDGTPVMEGWEKFRRLYCIMMINCFSVSGPLDIKQGHDNWLGLGFYLNTSRFNHSCCPDMYVDFVGSRLIMRYPSYASNDEDAAKELAQLTKSGSTFNRLTINYGYAHSFTSDCFFPLRQQRRAALSYGYYFRCECVLCSDSVEASLEEHAAALECNQCGQPCVWKRKPQATLNCCTSTGKYKAVCGKSCQCKWNKTDVDDAKTYTRSLEPDVELQALEDAWTKVMAPPMKEVTANGIIKMCEPVLMKARYFWHRWANLRMVQLNERCFVGYATAVMEARKRQMPIDRHVLKMALETGMVVISWCDNRPFNAAYHTIMAAYSYRLGRLYDVSALLNDSPQHRKCATGCYSYAAAIWDSLGDRAAAIVNKLRALGEAEQIDTEIDF